MSLKAHLLILMVVIVGFPVNHAHSDNNPVLWPEECKGRSYCDTEPSYYPKEKIRELLDKVAMNYTIGTVGRRSGANDDDVACPKTLTMQKIYLIKDKNDEIRFVAQTDKFDIKVVVEECKKPGRVKDAPGLKRNQLKKSLVECTEKMVAFKFPVLTLDQQALESVAPKGGISLSCSAKVMK